MAQAQRSVGQGCRQQSLVPPTQPTSGSLGALLWGAGLVGNTQGAQQGAQRVAHKGPSQGHACIVQGAPLVAWLLARPGLGPKRD